VLPIPDYPSQYLLYFFWYILFTFTDFLTYILYIHIQREIILYLSLTKHPNSQNFLTLLAYLFKQ
jgi:hypothetical protein